jgi:hypothetical protein
MVKHLIFFIVFILFISLNGLWEILNYGIIGNGSEFEFVTLKIFNLLGEEVATLVKEKLQVGNYTYTFDGSNLASGVYLYRIETGEWRDVKKMILIK